MIRSIITHPGGAHKDDFLACALLLADAPVMIDRREPTTAELADPTIAVVDIGHRHEPPLNNFDHHQFPRETPPTCSLSLILQHLGLYEDAREFCEWLEVVEWFDCRGPNETAAWLGTDRNTLGQLNSPIDISLLRRFGGRNIHAPGEPIWELMRMIGEDLITYITSLRERLNFIHQHAEVWQLDGFKALFMPRTDPLPEEPSAGLERYILRENLETDLLAMVYPDRRGEGFGLRRIDDHPRVDFTRLRDEPDIHFAHQQGFIAKTSAEDPTRLKTLLTNAFHP